MTFTKAGFLGLGKKRARDARSEATVELDAQGRVAKIESSLYG